MTVSAREIIFRILFFLFFFFSLFHPVILTRSQPAIAQPQVVVNRNLGLWYIATSGCGRSQLPLAHIYIYIL